MTFFLLFLICQLLTHFSKRVANSIQKHVLKLNLHNYVIYLSFPFYSAFTIKWKYLMVRIVEVFYIQMQVLFIWELWIIRTIYFPFTRHVSHKIFLFIYFKLQVPEWKLKRILEVFPYSENANKLNFFITRWILLSILANMLHCLNRLWNIFMSV